MFTCVKVPVILELKVTIPQQYGPEQPFDITKDVTCIGDEDDGDEDGCEDGGHVNGEDGDGCEDGGHDALIYDALVKSK